jgi:hypothetical protein
MLMLIISHLHPISILILIRRLSFAQDMETDLTRMSDAPKNEQGERVHETKEKEQHLVISRVLGGTSTSGEGEIRVTGVSRAMK